MACGPRIGGRAAPGRRMRRRPGRCTPAWFFSWRLPCSSSLSANATPTRRAPTWDTPPGRLVLVRLRAALLRDLRPLRDFRAHERGELRARAPDGREREALQLLLRLGRREHLLDLGIELVEDRGRRLRRRGEPDPADGLEPRIALLGDRRHVGEEWRSLGYRDPEWTQLPRGHLALHARHRVRHRRHA